LTTTARKEQLIDEETVGAILLAALLSIILSPILLRLVLTFYKRRAENAIAEARLHTAKGAKENPVSGLKFCFRRIINFEQCRFLWLGSFDLESLNRLKKIISGVLLHSISEQIALGGPRSNVKNSRAYGYVHH
jgi:hypothetical protein